MSMTSIPLLARGTTSESEYRDSASPRTTSRDLAKHIIQFDPEDRSTYAQFSLPQALLASAAARSPIPWPAGQAPTPSPLSAAPQEDAPLPEFDYLVVTWTVAEAKCLADTLTPGYPSKTAWYD